MNRAAAALDYAALGWPVFPCRPRGKAPLLPSAHPDGHPCRGECGRDGHGLYDATIDRARITDWWTRWPDANVAIPTGRPTTFDVLDVDCRPNGTGWPAFNRAKRAGLLDGAFRIVRTPSSGAHLYYPPAGRGGGSIRGQHLDYKATGGYVLTPPSVVATDDYTGPYVEIEQRWGAAGPLDWPAVAAMLAPPPPLRRIGPTSRHGTLATLVLWVAGQPEGNRNHALYWACRRAAEAGHRDLSALVLAGVSAGLDERGAQRTADSALDAAGRAS